MSEQQPVSNSVPTSPLVLRRTSSAGGKAYSVSPSMEPGAERSDVIRAARMSGSSPLGSYSEEETTVREWRVRELMVGTMWMHDHMRLIITMCQLSLLL